MNKFINHPIIQHLESNACVINKISIESNKNTKTVEIDIETRQTRLTLTFFNATSIRVDFHMSDLTIHGLRIIDNIKNGWSSEVGYHLVDVEDNLIDFYFEDCFIALK